MNALGGVGVALVTPLNSDYSIDYHGLEKVVNHVIEGGVDYLVVQGTTGESPVFSWREKLSILEFILDKANDRVPTVFGLGGNNTFDLIEKSKDLEQLPLTAILSASPYYSRPSQEGIIRHFQLLADAFPHPIILYNVPARTASNMEAQTTLSLAEHPNIIAMKEASADLQQCKEIMEHQPDDFTFLSGEDSITYELLVQGASGVISVIGNLYPGPFAEMVHTAMKKDLEGAELLNDALREIYQLASEEGNPSSIKAGLEAKGICKRTVKPPLFDASDALVQAWSKLMQ